MPQLTSQEITDKVLEGTFGTPTAQRSRDDMFKPVRPEHDSLSPRPRKPRKKTHR